MENEINPDIAAGIETSIDDYNARQLMVMALIRSGFSNEQIVQQAKVTRKQYNDIKELYDKGNYDRLCSDVIDNWGVVIQAKLMQVTEKALDKTLTYMENDLIKDAKVASSIVTENFGTFRLSTGKSTENIETTAIRLTQMIESRTGLQKPNQSQYHPDNPPQIKEITA